MIGFRRPGPLAQMTLALVTMTVSIVLLADLLLGVTGHRDQQRRALRQQLSESIAVQAAVLLQGDDEATLERTLREVLVRVQDLRSIGLRRDDGALLLAAGPHAAAWQHGDDPAASTADQLRVPLAANGRPWGAVELVFRPEQGAWWQQLALSPLARLLLFVVVVGAVGYALYMRRALQHLDPAAVIPERVQRAFDAMAEGVVVLDARGRVMLANRAFRALGEGRSPVRVGQSLSAVDWLAAALPGDPAAHPWMRAMTERRNTAGDALAVAADDGARSLVVGCAPITDTGGALRGCMVTFNDMSELHRANAALQRAMGELEANREQLRQHNEKLRRLATRDPLTGCLNRRAFMDGAPGLLRAASASDTPLACLMLDIDHFKSINDNHGHGIGDRVIAETARVMLDTARRGDLVCRYGGEEFCIVAPCCDASAIVTLGERIRQQVQAVVAARIPEAPGLRVTISVGASRLDGADDTLAAMIERADQALYRAKRGGRNRVVEFTADADAAAVAAG